MRLGINIPNDLHRRLVPFKQYVSVSQVCREAIEDCVRAYEKAVARGRHPNIVRAMEQVWEEERKIKDAVGVDWGMLGYQDAKCWVETAWRTDWEYLHHRQEIIQRQGRPRWDFPPPHLGGVKGFDERYAELLNRIREQEYRFLDWLYYEHGGMDREAAQREYMLAWLAHTDAAWELFCEMRGRYLEERRRERLEARANRPDPAVPKKLLDELESDSGRRGSSPGPSELGQTNAPSL